MKIRALGQAALLAGLLAGCSSRAVVTDGGGGDGAMCFVDFPCRDGQKLSCTSATDYVELRTVWCEEVCPKGAPCSGGVCMATGVSGKCPAGQLCVKVGSGYEAYDRCAAPDSRVPDAAAPDLMPPSSAYLLWQAPGGFAGTGAALEVLADGTVHLWASTPSLQPHQTKGWSTQLTLGAAQVASLFALLSQVPWTKLPHDLGTWAECYPTLRYEPCATCEAIDLTYKSAKELQPELDPVYLWLKQNLMTAIALPDSYCSF